MENKRIRTLLLLSVAVLALTACDKPADKEAKYLRQGEAYFEKGEYDKARLAYKNAARIAPADAETSYRLGLVDEAEKNFQKAYKAFMAASQQDPAHKGALLKLAQYAMLAGAYDKTEEILGKVLAAHPEDATAHALNAALMMRQKKDVEAEKEARVALKEDPKQQMAYSVLINMAKAKNDLPKAADLAEEASKAMPENLPLQMLRASIYASMKDDAKMEATFEAIYKLRPQAAQFRMDLAGIYLKEGKMDKAEATLRKGVEALPTSWEMKKDLVVFLNDHKGMQAAEDEIATLRKAYPDKEDLDFWMADLYLKNNAMDKAKALLEKIAANTENEKPSLMAQASLARIQINEGNKDVAQKLIGEVLKKEPNNEEALFLKARLAFEADALDQAILPLREILREHPKSERTLQFLGEVLLKQRKIDLAIDSFTKAATENPSNLNVKVRLAQLYSMNGDSRKAFDILKIVTKADPTYAPGWESLARIAIAAKDWTTAGFAINTLESLEGQKTTASFLKANLLSANGSAAEAMTQFKQTYKMAPGTDLGNLALAGFVNEAVKAKKSEEALDLFEGIKKRSPYEETLYGEMLVRVNRNDAAIKAFDLAIEEGFSDPAPYLDKAQLMLEKNKTEEALEALREAEKKLPNDPRAAMLEGDILLQTGRFEEAIALYEKVVERMPENDVAANNLAQLLADTKPNDEKALEKARHLAERFISGTNPDYLDTLAWVYTREGKLDQALALQERIQKANPQAIPQIFYHRGVLLAKKGRKEEARKVLELAVKTKEIYPGLEEAKKLLLELGGSLPTPTGK